MERELAVIPGREADAPTAEDLSRFFREQVVRNAEVLYAFQRERESPSSDFGGRSRGRWLSEETGARHAAASAEPFQNPAPRHRLIGDEEGRRREIEHGLEARTHLCDCARGV
jgi:hypothetical protein